MLQLPRLFRVQAALLWLLRDVSKLSCRFSSQLSPLSLSPVPPMCSTLSKHVFFSSSLVLGFPDSLQVVSVNRGSCGRNRIVINLSEQKGSEMQYTTGQGQFLHSDVWQNGYLCYFSYRDTYLPPPRSYPVCSQQCPGDLLGPLLDPCSEPAERALGRAPTSGAPRGVWGSPKAVRGLHEKLANW